MATNILTPITISEISEQLFEKIKKELFSITRQEDKKKYLTVDEVCEEYNFKKPTLYALTSKRLISYLKPGKTLMFLRDDIEAFIEASRRKTNVELKQEFLNSLGSNDDTKGLNYEK